jgi:hypothetical protein
VPHCVDLQSRIGYMTLKQNQINNLDQYLPTVSNEVEEEHEPLEKVPRFTL